LVSGRIPGDRVRNVFADTALAWAVLEGMADTPMTREMKRSKDLDTATTTPPDTSTPKIRPFAQESEAEQNTREVVNNLRLRRAMDSMADPYILDKAIEAQNTAEDTPKDAAVSPRNTPTKRLLEDTLATAQKALTKANKLEAENEALRMVVFDLAYTVSAQQDRLCEQYTMYGRLSARVDRRDMEEYFAQVQMQKDTHTDKKKGPYLFPAAEPIQEAQEDDHFKYLEENDPDTAIKADTMAFTAGTLISLPNDCTPEAEVQHTAEKDE